MAETSEIMAPGPTKIQMSFQPLLETITDHLHLLKPSYQIIQGQQNVKITIMYEDGKAKHEYNSENAVTVQAAFEQAARRAVEDLAKQYFIYIEDLTSMKHQDIDRCTELYSLKCVELERLEKTWGRIHLTENLLAETCGFDSIVAVDFIPILRSVLRAFNIPTTPLETIEHTPTTFTAWITVTPKGTFGVPQTIFGEYRNTMEAAKQNLARKVLTYLTPIYNFEVVDANYNPRKMKQQAARCARERQRYLTLKERVLGLKEKYEPTYLLVEQDCVTPKAAAFKIPQATGPPVPPKKRRSNYFRGSSSQPLQPEIDPTWTWPSPPLLKIRYSRSI